MTVPAEPDFISAATSFGEALVRFRKSPTIEEDVATLLVSDRWAGLILLSGSDSKLKARCAGILIRDLVSGGYAHLPLLRDVLRCAPRTPLEKELERLLPEMLSTLDDFGFDRLIELAVELRLKRVLELVITAAAAHSEQDIQELAQGLEAIESDDRRWGRLVSEWPTA